MRKSRYKRYLKYKSYVRITRGGMLLLLLIFLILFLTVEFRKQIFLPEDRYMFKVLPGYDKTTFKLYDGKIVLRIDKALINNLYKSVNYLYFKSRGYIFYSPSGW